MRKTALLSGVAGLFLMTAPAIAQDGMAPQTLPASPPPAAAEPAQTAPTLTLQPGMTVRGGDGDLGVLVGARTEAGSQQLVVQGADGTARAVPITGIRQDGEVVVVDFTLEQFGAAATVTAPAVPAQPAVPAVPAVPAAPADPAMTPDDAAAPVDETMAPPVEPPVASPPTLPPEDPAAPTAPPSPTPATPAPGEGADQDPNNPGA